MSIQKDSWFHSDKGIKDFWTSWTAWHCEGFWNLKKKKKKRQQKMKPTMEHVWVLSLRGQALWSDPGLCGSFA